MNSQPSISTDTATPGELPLTLAIDVLRLPYPVSTRFVLAEILRLHEATGNCYCSDAYLAARLSISKSTANHAVQQLVADGLVQKQVDQAAGNRRLLVPTKATEITAQCPLSLKAED
jgi:biotin operon repressor